MKKLLALILAGITVLGMSMVAIAAPNDGQWPDGPSVTDYHCHCTLPCASGPDCMCMSIWQAKDCNCAGGSSSDGRIAYWVNQGLSPEEIAIAQASEEAALAQEATGIPWATAIAAADENKSVGEYMNNAATATPGLSTVTPVAQGGNVIINGQPSNQTFSVNKPLLAHVDSAKAQAAAVGGNVLNCVDVDGAVYFDTATVNFYMPGVVSGQNIQVYHFANGVWSPVNVAEIREDHVVVDMTAYGILAFIEVPTEVAAE